MGHGEGQDASQGDLELFGTQELLDELLRRSTFQGVVIHAEGDVRRSDWEGERVFKVRFNHNLVHEEARRLLSAVSEHMTLAGD